MYMYEQIVICFFSTFFSRQAQFLRTLELRKKAVKFNIYLNEKIKVNLRYDLM